MTRVCAIRRKPFFRAIQQPYNNGIENNLSRPLQIMEGLMWRPQGWRQANSSGRNSLGEGRTKGNSSNSQGWHLIVYGMATARTLVDGEAHPLPEVLRLDLFKATAARISSLSAGSSTSSPSWKSMARLVFPSRLELEICEGSGSDAPLAKVSFTTLL